MFIDDKKKKFQFHPCHYVYQLWIPASTTNPINSLQSSSNILSQNILRLFHQPVEASTADASSLSPQPRNSRRNTEIRTRAGKRVLPFYLLNAEMKQHCCYTRQCFLLLLCYQRSFTKETRKFFVRRERLNLALHQHFLKAGKCPLINSKFPTARTKIWCKD